MPNRRPPWWPDNEKWPGANRWPRWGLGLVLIPIIFFISMGFLVGRGRHGPWFLWPMGILFFVALARRRNRPRWFPVSRLVDAAGRLAAGDYTVRVPDIQGGPMRDVIHSFNGMASQLEHSAEQRRRWLADLGHELRNPLTVIQGELEAMIDGVHQPNQEQLAMLLDEAGVMARLLDDLRTLSLTEAGELKLEKDLVEVRVIVEEVLASLRDVARRRELTLLSEIAEGTIEVDPFRLREVLSNIGTNALRHANRVVSVAAHEERGTWSITVHDDGPGISEHLLPRVFDRFVKGGNSKGTGLGLSIARALVEAHGGTINVVSSPGTGTLFTITLPAR
ncbi:N/A [soil metagenome]